MDQRSAVVRGRGRRGRGRGRRCVAIPESYTGDFNTSYHQVMEEKVAQQASTEGEIQQENGLLNVLRELQAKIDEERDETNQLIKIYETARRVGVEDFRGTTDPSVADDWYRETMKALDLMKCNDQDRLSCLTYLLKGDADVWWNNIRRSQADPNAITLQFFKKKFRAQYIPRVYKERKIQDFISLKQEEGMTVEEYRLCFQRLERFARSIIPTEIDKCRKFRRGLHVKIRGNMAIQSTQVFDELVEIALQVEEIVKEEEAEKEEVRKRSYLGVAASNYGEGPSKKRDIYSLHSDFRGGSSKQGGDLRSWMSHAFLESVGTEGGAKRIHTPSELVETQQERPRCGRCRRFHIGPCHQGYTRCYHCGEEGHVKKECPYRTSSSQCYVGSQEGRRQGYA